MGLGKKLTTLIMATLRSGLSRPSRPRFAGAGDPEAQLAAAQKALAEVQAREQAVVAQLQIVQDRLQTAVDSGDQEEARRQQHLANQLEAHLKTQTSQTIALSGKLAEVESQLTQNKPVETDQPASATTASASTAEQSTSSSSQARPDSAPPTAAGASTSPADDGDLTARKSRLSG